MWEEEVLVSLMEDLEGVRLSNEVDVWRWKLEDHGIFLVSSSYKKLEGLTLSEVSWSEGEKGVFEKLWKSPAPSRVVAFAWRALLNRVHTKIKLALRNVLGADDSKACVMCNNLEESSTHLFLHCEVASSVWFKLMWWLDNFFIIPPNLFVHWECWGEGERNKMVKTGFGLIWHATIWALWKARNDFIFKEVSLAVDDIVENVKVLSWRWVLGRTHLPACLFFEWCWNPKLCLARVNRRM